MTPTADDRRDATLGPAIALAAAVTAARLAYLRWVCPYNLVEDEAHYWLWSRFLDWSYYSKGPAVAWVIALSTRLLGNAEWAVRVPSAVLMGLGTLAAAGLTRDLAARAWESAERDGTASGRPPWAVPRSAALLAAAAFVLAPALQMVGVLMTVDAPYISCWAVACWAFWRAAESGSRRAWLLLGTAVAAGFLFKYTMLLVIPGLALYAWLRRGSLRPCARWPAWLGAAAGISAIGLAPVLIWNAQHGWPTVKHLLGHLGLSGGDMPLAAPGVGFTDSGPGWSPLWSLELIGQQLGMIGPALLLAGFVAWRTLRGRRDRASAPNPPDPRAPGRLYLACCALPILAFYLAVSFITEPEGNWPIAAYATLMPLAGWAAADVLAAKRRAVARGEPKPRGTRVVRVLWRSALLYGLLAATTLHFAGHWADALNTVSATGRFTSAFHALMGRAPRPIVVGRLFGAREMSRHVAALLNDLGPAAAPFVLTQHYGRASQLAYYLPTMGLDTPVLCAMAYAGGRRSQFDLWDHTRLDRPDLAGHNAVILSNNAAVTLKVWRSLFESVEPIPARGGRLAGEHKPDRVAFIGRSYRALPRAGAPADAAKDSPPARAKDSP